MVEQHANGFVAECYWPDVSEQVVRENEVVLCQFERTSNAVRELVERAEVPFERILESTTYRAKGGTRT